MDRFTLIVSILLENRTKTERITEYVNFHLKW